MTDISRIADAYIEVLSNRMGLSAHQRDNVVIVELQPGLKGMILLHESDPEYLHLVVGFRASERDASVEELKRICAGRTEKSKVVKVIVDEDGDLRFSAEMLVAAPDCIPTTDHLQAVLPRTITMMRENIRRTLTEIEFTQLTAEMATSGD